MKVKVKKLFKDEALSKIKIGKIKNVNFFSPKLFCTKIAKKHSQVK